MTIRYAPPASVTTDAISTPTGQKQKPEQEQGELGGSVLEMF